MLDPDTNAPGGYPYISQDGGASWHSTLREQGRRWSSVACSADGAKLLACVYEGGLYTSTDAGATWLQHLTDTAHRWWRVACSADGSLMSAKGCDGEIFLSRDGGSQWEASLLDTPNCGSLTTSADGQRLVAITGVSTSKLIAVSAPSTTPGPSTQISGDASAQMQLAYAGSNHVPYFPVRSGLKASWLNPPIPPSRRLLGEQSRPWLPDPHCASAFWPRMALTRIQQSAERRKTT